MTNNYVQLFMYKLHFLKIFFVMTNNYVHIIMYKTVQVDPQPSVLVERSKPQVYNFKFKEVKNVIMGLRGIYAPFYTAFEGDI